MSAESDRGIGLIALNDAYRSLMVERDRIKHPAVRKILSLTMAYALRRADDLRHIQLCSGQLPDTIILGED